MFKDCIESLLEREDQPGFRGVQSKSLVDIIQLECLSQSSSVLRITNGPLVGKIWINHGELFDAEAGNLQAEEAFQHILSWKTGNFEVLPAEENHAQAIKTSYNALLLQSAQAIDEARGERDGFNAPSPDRPTHDPLTQLQHLDFFIAAKPGAKPMEMRGIENPERVAEWAHALLARFRGLGDRLQAGQPDTIIALGDDRHLGVTYQGEVTICAGWRDTRDASQLRRFTKKAAALWVS